MKLALGKTQKFEESDMDPQETITEASVAWVKKDFLDEDLPYLPTDNIS